MDIARIRAMLGECFEAQDDPRGISAEQDYNEAAQALRALKSMFEMELESRTTPAPLRAAEKDR